MKCPGCQFENPEASLFLASLFCGKCGTSLKVVCTNCCTNPPAAFSFCNECGHDLIERKDTLLFDYSQPQSRSLFAPRRLKKC